MLRLRFVPGLILGIVVGLPLGALLVLLLRPAPSSDPGAVSLQVQELNRKLEALQDQKQRADEQLAQFAKLADEMTTGFNALERRFKALEEQEQSRLSRADQPAAAPGIPPTAAAPGATPTTAPANSTPTAGDTPAGPRTDANSVTQPAHALPAPL